MQHHSWTPPSRFSGDKRRASAVFTCGYIHNIHTTGTYGKVLYPILLLNSKEEMNAFWAPIHGLGHLNQPPRGQSFPPKWGRVIMADT